MRATFVPSYYSRDLLHNLQQLNQGNKSVEEYYQELQKGMLRCGLVESEDGAIARFMGGLNRDIQDILAYKDYDSVTHLFHLACKGEREVQGRRASTRTNIPAGRTSSWTHATTGCQSNRAAAPSSSVTISLHQILHQVQVNQQEGQQAHQLKVRPRLHQPDDTRHPVPSLQGLRPRVQGLPKCTCNGCASRWWVFLR